MSDDLYKTLNCIWTKEIESLEDGMKRKTYHFAWFCVEDTLNTHIGDGEDTRKVRAGDPDEIFRRDTRDGPRGYLG